MVALTYRATVDVPARFRKSKFSRSGIWADVRQVSIRRIGSALVHIKINSANDGTTNANNLEPPLLLIEEHGEKSYCIHEVHYDEDGSVMGWTQNAIAVFVP